MVKKNLDGEDLSLWRRYTKDVEPINVSYKVPASTAPKADFKIKVPAANGFKKRAPSTLSNHGSLKNRDANWGKKLKSGKIKPEGKIDLHGMTCVEAHDKLHQYLSRAQRSGKRVILVVTGKGGPKNNYDQYRFVDYSDSRGVLRREVPMWLSGSAMRHLIVSFQEARAQDGGAGALYVILKRMS